jgi:hypothetical protein
MMAAMLRRAAQLVMGLLRELGDENAYQRHLQAHGVPHSAEEWRRFSKHRMQAKYTRPKCC